MGVEGEVEGLLAASEGAVRVCLMLRDLTLSLVRLAAVLALSLAPSCIAM